MNIPQIAATTILAASTFSAGFSLGNVYRPPVQPPTIREVRVQVPIAPPCHEDEVWAVQIDTDPTHDLTWACENSEDYIRRMPLPRPALTPVNGTLRGKQ